MSFLGCPGCERHSSTSSIENGPERVAGVPLKVVAPEHADTCIRQKLAQHGWPPSIYRLLPASVGQEAMQRHGSVESSGLFRNIIGAQEVAHAPTGSDDAHRYTASQELVMQAVEHARTRKIDIRRRRKVANDQMNVG